jgi:hypothetical protein
MMLAWVAQHVAPKGLVSRLPCRKERNAAESSDGNSENKLCRPRSGGGPASVDHRQPGIVTKWLAKGCLFWYGVAMSKLLEIEAALGQLPPQEQWEVARWLLDALEQRSGRAAKGQKDGSVTALPDYAARRRRIFGDKVLPNMVLVSRSEERW